MEIDSPIFNASVAECFPRTQALSDLCASDQPGVIIVRVLIIEQSCILGV